MPLFYDHQSVEEISIKLQIKELANWIEHIEFIKVEINYLSKLKKELTINEFLNLELLNKKEEAEDLLSLFYDYKINVENSFECIEVACNMYYINQHEILREQYLNFVSEYKCLKVEIFG